MNRAVEYPEALGFVRAFAEGLAELGWVTGQNVRIDYRWYAGDADAARKYAAELTTLEPDIFLASGTLGVAALQSLTRSVPTVFTLVTDPVGAGFVNSLARATTTVFPRLWPLWWRSRSMPFWPRVQFRRALTPVSQAVI
jgi:putative tryptophan/tyrosine transport system substrate-binding protein